MRKDLAPYFGALAPLEVTSEAPVMKCLMAALEALEVDWGELEGLDSFLVELAGRVCACTCDELDQGPSQVQTLERLELADLYLAARCAAHDTQALRRLETRCIEPLTRVIARVDPAPVFIDDIKQRIRTKLLLAEGERPARIHTYAGRGPLDAWVRVIAAREAISEKRRRQPWTDTDPIGLDVEASLTSPELGLIKEQYRVEFERALSQAMASLSPEQRNLLRHHYLHGLSFDEIGGIYALHRSSVARHIAKARKTLLADTRRMLAAELATDHAEFERLLELIASRIDLSIERHLHGGVNARLSG